MNELLVSRDYQEGQMMLERITRSAETTAGETAAANGVKPADSDDERSEKVLITPDLAGDWLVRPSKNRPLNARIVRNYAAAMQRGEWTVTGDTIKFDRHDRLVDGQHRLAAIVESGATIWSWVIWGVEANAFDDMDSGHKRQMSAILQMHGYHNAHALAAGSLLLIAYDWYGDFVTSRPDRRFPSRKQQLEAIQNHPGLEESLRRCGRTGIRQLVASRSLPGVLHYIFSSIDADDAEAFFTLLETGENLQLGHPVYALRKRLIDNISSTTKLPANHLAALFVKAWNAYRAGKDIKALSWRPGGAKPEPFPTIS